MKLGAFLSQVTIEPCLFLTVVASTFSLLAVQNIIGQKTCSPDVQPSIDFICNDSVQVSAATDISLTKNTIKSVLTACSVPLIGSWRDVTGNNKLLIYLALAADMIIAGMYLVSAWIWSMSPWIPAMIEGVLGGLFSGCLDLAATCIIAESSAPEDRTIRFQFLVVSSLSGSGVGALVNGILLTSLGYIWFFAVLMSLYIIGLALAMILVKQKITVENKKNIEIIEKFKFVFQSRPNGAVIWIMLIVGAIVPNLFMAEGTVAVYYYQQKFAFSMTQIGLYGAYRLLFCVLGGILISPLFTKVFKWSDFKIGMASSLLSIVSALCMVEAATMVDLYLFPVLDSLKFLLFAPPKAVISKCVQNDKLGTIMGFGSIVTIILPFIINYFYNEVFSATSKKMPGAFFLVTAAGSAVLLLCFNVASCLYQEPKKQSIENQEKTVDGKQQNNITLKTVSV